MRLPRSLLPLSAAAILAATAWLLWSGTGRLQPAPAIQAGVVTASAEAELPAFLPVEAAPVIRRIQFGAPHPHRQDGSVFGNRERRLPARTHGYYREYTVPTPGLSHRGARRIVTGGDPPRDWYYTADHYGSFRAFQPPATEHRQ
ncbi:ribonuclease domain-containing protein [Pseudoxanthomonas suwonensis]|uniref:Ribonuclease n=1 Tax=Pseudoxanthomonas suwonensis TaxID=314722 RepID=A0A0E3YZ81_9GAMM|nr:ribonuclease domain-containing protein [Pseudoxanthomonas suwonensis]AKC85412.1 ribonuclease [Pseudoxanthomonas suwonensis]